jgi:hypothetical protein
MLEELPDPYRETPRQDDVVELAAFTFTVEQAVKRFKEAGFPRDARTIVRWCKQGALQAAKQPTKTGLVRYVINAPSIDAKIALLRQEHDEQTYPSLYRPANHDTPNGAVVAGRYDHDTHDDGAASPSLGWRPERDQIAELRGELRAVKAEAEKKDRQLEKLTTENGGLRLALGEARGKVEVLRERVQLLEAPKSTEPTTTKPPPTQASWWRRLFG